MNINGALGFHYSMKKYYSLIIKTLIVSVLLHYLFIMYFPIEWLEKLSVFQNELSDKNYSIQQEMEVTLIGNSKANKSLESDQGDQMSSESGNSQGDFSDELNQEGLDQEGLDTEKWGDLIHRLDANTGFKDKYTESYDDLIENSKVGNSYIHRDRKNEDIVVKEVFPTIYSIDQSFEDTLKVAPKKLDEFVERNDIIEQYRSQNSDEKTQLTVKLLSKDSAANLGPLKFPPAERQAFFDKTLSLDKTEQLSSFIKKYFSYDPNEGDLPIATRELYSENLERLLYSFSSDPTFFYLDFYLENLNKEDFLHNALSQASLLDGTKTASELLFSIERIYEIQQRAWGAYFDFDLLFQNIPPERRERLRVETLKRVNERYKEVLRKKDIKSFTDIKEKYLKRRYEIIEHIVNNTPDAYRLPDALFERAVILWEMGLQNNDEKAKQQAINQWQALIDEAKKTNFSPSAYSSDFINLPHLRLLDALLRVYQNEPADRKAIREKQISDALMQRRSEQFTKKRAREKRILWPD